MPIRLVAARCVLMLLVMRWWHGVHWYAFALTLTSKRAAHSLVRVWRLLHDYLLLRVAAARTAARGDEPEEARGERKGYGEPDDRQHACANGCFDLVCFQHRVEGGDKRAVQDGGSECSGEGECRRDGGDNGGYAASPSAEDGENADDDFGEGDPESDRVRGEHPLADLLIHLETVLELVWDQVADAGVVQTPYIHHVEPEAGLARGAVVDRVPAIRSLVSSAVVPNVDGVDVSEGGVAVGGLEAVEEIVVDGRAVRDGEIGVCCEIGRVGLD